MFFCVRNLFMDQSLANKWSKNTLEMIQNCSYLATTVTQFLLFEDDKFIGDGHIGDIFNLAQPKSVNLGDNSMQWNVCPFWY